MKAGYSELYLEQVRNNLAVMMDMATNCLGYDITDFYDMFAVSIVAKGIENGNPTMLVGHSGIELVMEVLLADGLPVPSCDEWTSYEKLDYNRSPQYWLGWALAYYQWQQAIPFIKIPDIRSINEIEKMYEIYHEMDILHFTGALEEIRLVKEKESRLGQVRRISGYTQRLLAKESGVPLRTIQQYEQNQKDISKAKTESVISLANVLGCDSKDII